MIELAFVACLMTVPDTCEDRSLLYSGTSTGRCWLEATVALAGWAATHPDWEIGKWTCRLIDTSTQDI